MNLASALLATTESLASSVLRQPFVWALLIGVVGLVLAIPHTTHRRRIAGGILLLAALSLVAASLPAVADWFVSGVFWIFAGVTLVSAAAAMSMRSAVYSAVWFAMSLLGTAGLLLYQGAQFLAMATIIVYAGAIVVTLLFVIMLAQPEGLASYDRISWSWYVKPLSAVAAAAMVGVLNVALQGLANAGEMPTDALQQNVLHSDHVARFGAELFSRHLVAVEITGTLLLVALVGAVSIMLQTQRPARGREEQSHA